MEDSSISTILTKDKIVSCIARKAYLPSSKTHFASMMLQKISFDFSEDRKFLKDVKLEEDNSSLYEDIVLSLASQVFVEASIKTLQEQDQIPYLYFEEGIRLLKEGFDPLTLVLIYLAVISKVCGFAINIDSCLDCGNKKNLVSFSFSEGGFFCKNCAQEEGMKKSDITYMNIIRYIYMVDEKQMGRAKLPPMALDVLHEMYHYYIDATGVQLNSVIEFMKVYKKGE